MLKLKYLFPNADLAEMLVKKWEYDDLELFKYWRISSNAIYPFRNKGQVYFLRFAPVEEKEENSVRAELEFLKYLKKNKYDAAEPVPSIEGRELEIIETPWGKYIACVFKRVEGDALSDVEMTDDAAFLYGRALGQLHNLNQAYKPAGFRRRNWREQLAWVRDVLEGFPDEKDGIREADLLIEYFSSLPVRDDNYGLIHYDFELDNVFYDESTKKISPIDFDDAMYHWYEADIEQSIDSIKDEISPDRAEQVIGEFLRGYSTERPVAEDMDRRLPIFRRFANLYGYARVLQAAREKWDNEPEWLNGLRKKLDRLMEKRSSRFGKLIDR